MARPIAHDAHGHDGGPDGHGWPEPRDLRTPRGRGAPERPGGFGKAGLALVGVSALAAALTTFVLLRDGDGKETTPSRAVVAAEPARGVPPGSTTQVPEIRRGAVPLQEVFPAMTVPAGNSQGTPARSLFAESARQQESETRTAPEPVRVEEPRRADTSRRVTAAPDPEPASPRETASISPVPSIMPPGVPDGTARAGVSTGIDGLLAAGKRLVSVGDIAGARLVLERAAVSKDPRALAALAETFDGDALRRWGVKGVRPDQDRAESLYREAGVPRKTTH